LERYNCLRTMRAMRCIYIVADSTGIARMVISVALRGPRAHRRGAVCASLTVGRDDTQCRPLRDAEADSARERFVGSECFHLAPQCRQIEHQALTAGYGSYRVSRGAQRADIPAVGTALEDLEAASLRIDQPVPADPERGVVVHLLDAVAAYIGLPRRNHLDRNVGRQSH